MSLRITENNFHKGNQEQNENDTSFDTENDEND